MAEELIILGISVNDIYIAVPEFYENPQKENLCRWNEYTFLRYFEKAPQRGGHDEDQ